MLDGYEMLRLIGQGGYGFTYIVRGCSDGEFYAMKIEKNTGETRGLRFEIGFYEDLRDSPFFPRVYRSVEDGEYRYIVMEILGPSFFNLKQEMPRQRFSKYTAFFAGYHMLRCLEELHERGFVHRDIKLGNFLLRRDAQTPVCLIDFGLSKRYVDKKTGRVYKPRENLGFIGTTKYASVSALSGNEVSKADDLESWFYTLVDMATGELPWAALKKDKDKVLEAKKNISPQKLCRGLPSKMVDVYVYITGLGYMDTPNYSYVYGVLEEIIQEEKKKHKCLDWEKLSRKKLKKISGIDIRENIEEGKCPVFYKENDIGSGICEIQ